MSASCDLVGLQTYAASKRTYILNFYSASAAATAREAFILEGCKTIDVTAEIEEKYKEYYEKGEAGTFKTTAHTSFSYSFKPDTFPSEVSFDEREFGRSETDAYGSYTKPDHHGRPGTWLPPYVLQFWSYEYQRARKTENKCARAEARKREAARTAAALKRIEMRTAQRAAKSKRTTPTPELRAWHADAMVKLKARRSRGTSSDLEDYSPLEEMSRRFGSLVAPVERAPLKLNATVSIESRAKSDVSEL